MTDTRAIWKFPVASPGETIDMPVGARIVAVGQQSGGLVFWAEVNPNEQYRLPRRFQVVGTGWEFPAHLDYHGTVQFANGLVWHLLEDE